MSAKDLLNKDAWLDIFDALNGTAKDWWAEYEDDLQSLAGAEAKAVAAALKRGRVDEAKLLIAGSMDPDDFGAYVKGTTAQLQGIAYRRARLMEALEDLGIRSAKVIGEAVLRAFAA